MSTAADREKVSVTRAMEETTLSRSQVKNLLDDGVLEGTPACGTGRTRYVYRASLDAYVAAHPPTADRRGKGVGARVDALTERVDLLTTLVEDLRQKDPPPSALAPTGSTSAVLTGSSNETGRLRQQVSDLEWALAKNNEATDKLRKAAEREHKWREAVTELIKTGEEISTAYREAEQLRHEALGPFQTPTDPGAVTGAVVGGPRQGTTNVQ